MPMPSKHATGHAFPQIHVETPPDSWHVAGAAMATMASWSDPHIANQENILRSKCYYFALQGTVRNISPHPCELSFACRLQVQYNSAVTNQHTVCSHSLRWPLQRRGSPPVLYPATHLQWWCHPLAQMALVPSHLSEARQLAHQLQLPHLLRAAAGSGARAASGVPYSDTSARSKARYAATGAMTFSQNFMQ